MSCCSRRTARNLQVFGGVILPHGSAWYPPVEAPASSPRGHRPGSSDSLEAAGMRTGKGEQTEVLLTSAKDCEQLFLREPPLPGN